MAELSRKIISRAARHVVAGTVTLYVLALVALALSVGGCAVAPPQLPRLIILPVPVPEQIDVAPGKCSEYNLCFRDV